MPRKKKENEYSMVNGIRKTRDGKGYEAAIYIGLKNEVDKNGKPKKDYEWVRASTYAECKQLKIEKEKEVADGTHSKTAKLPFCEYADKWISLLDNSKADSTVKSYKMYIEKHFKPAFKRFKVEEIGEFNIKEYINDKLKEKLSPNTVRKHFFILNRMMQDAVKHKNPCEGIDPPKKQKYVPRVPTDEEFKLILDAVTGTFDELMVLLAGWCGLREGEIFALKWNDIDFKAGTIKVDEAMAIAIAIDDDMKIKPAGYEDKDPKSDNGIRTIVAPEHVMLLLESIKPHEDEKVIELNPGENKVFDMRPDSYSTRYGKMIEYHNELFDLRKKFGQAGIDNYLKNHRKDSIKMNLKIQNKKLPDIRFHDLRHYHATVLYDNNVDDLYAADRLGHDIQTLKEIYQHLQLKTRKKNDDKIKEIFK
jgi:integrase